MYFASINVILFREMHIFPNFYSRHFDSGFIWSYWSRKVRRERWNDLAKATWESGRTGTWAEAFHPYVWHLSNVADPRLFCSWQVCGWMPTGCSWTWSVDPESQYQWVKCTRWEIAGRETWGWEMSVKVVESAVLTGQGRSSPALWVSLGALHGSCLGGWRAGLDSLFLLLSLLSLSSDRVYVSSSALQCLQWESGTSSPCFQNIKQKSSSWWP